MRKFGWDRDRHRQRKYKVKTHGEKPDFYKPQRETCPHRSRRKPALPTPDPGHLASELWDNTCLSLKTGSFWDFVTAALTDTTGYQINWIFQFPNQGWNLHFLQWECVVLTVGQPGKSLWRTISLWTTDMLLNNLNSTLKKIPAGTSVAIQWLRLHVPNAGGTGLIPGQGTEIPHTA